MSHPGRPRHNGNRKPRPITLSKREVREAAKLLARIVGEDPEMLDVLLQPPPRSAADEDRAPDRHELLELARRALLERQHRTKLFSKVMFGEPAWDVLLALYIADFVSGRQTTGSIAFTIDTPVTTVVRWISYLEKEHMVSREPHPHDRRMMFVRLTEKSRELLSQYFLSLSK